MKTLDTLPADIDRLFFTGTEVSEKDLADFATNLTNILRDRLTPKIEEGPKLRMSKLGTPDLKLWYEQHQPKPREQGKNALKFVYGDMVEQLIIFLAKASGHTVEDEQKEFEIDGVVGHQDCKIDGVTVDVKSASSYAFRKFSERTLFRDDPFGYIAQLSAYSHSNGGNPASFIGVNKENGEVCILPLDRVDQIDPVQRVAQVKAIAAPTASKPKTKCYQPIPYNKGENLTLNKNCTYCPYHHDCWKDANGGKGLRYFQYAKEIVPLVSVVNTPRVDEVYPAAADGESEPAIGGEINSISGELPE